MPNLIFGDRKNPLDKELYERFIKETSINIDYKTFCSIIRKTNEIFKESIIEEEAGVQLPESMGTILITKYKSKKVPVDWVNSINLKKSIPLLNLHSFGYVHHIKWYKIGCTFANNYIYMFRPYRDLKRAVAKSIKEGKNYFQWENSDMWSSTKMQRRFEKFYKKVKK